MSKKQQANENLTQTDRFSAALKRISVDLTTDDRKAIMKGCSISQPTLTRYLGGRVDNLDTAAAIIQKAKEQIEQRELALEGI